MQLQTDYLLPELISVEERPDLRRSSRLTPDNLQVELTTSRFSHPLDSHCLNLSRQGIALLCDANDIAVGDRVTVRLLSNTRRARELGGRVVRAEISARFTRLAIQFDRQYITAAELIVIR